MQYSRRNWRAICSFSSFFSNYCSTESNKMQFKISWISWHDKNKICDFLCVFFANCHKLTLNYLEAIKKCGNNLKSFFPKKKKVFQHRANFNSIQLEFSHKKYIWIFAPKIEFSEKINWNLSLFQYEWKSETCHDFWQE